MKTEKEIKERLESIIKFRRDNPELRGFKTDYWRVGQIDALKWVLKEK